MALQALQSKDDCSDRTSGSDLFRVEGVAAEISAKAAAAAAKEQGNESKLACLQVYCNSY